MFIEYNYFAKSLHNCQNWRWNLQTLKNMIFGLETNDNLHNSHSVVEIGLSSLRWQCRTLHTSQNLRWNANIWLPKYANRHLTSNFGWCAIIYCAISIRKHIFLFNCVNYEGMHKFYHKKCFFVFFNFTCNFAKCANFLQINCIL